MNLGGFFGRIGGGVKNLIGRGGGAIGGLAGSFIPIVGTQIGGTIGGMAQKWAQGGKGSTTGKIRGGAKGAMTKTQLQQYQQKQYGYIPPSAGQTRGCFIATECYGNVPPQKFYDFRETLSNGIVKFYYKLSPYIVSLIHFTKTQKPVKWFINKIVKG